MILAFKVETIDASNIHIVDSKIETGASLKYNSANSVNIANSKVVSHVDISIESPVFSCANSTLVAPNIYLPEHSNIDQDNCMFDGVVHYGHVDL